MSASAVDRQTKTAPHASRVLSPQATVSAPGKLILMGEHAAVYGYPALVAAVDLRLTVSIEATEAPTVDLHQPELGLEGSTSWQAIRDLTSKARTAWKQGLGNPQALLQNRPGPATTTVGVTPAQLVQLSLGEASRSLEESDPGGIRLRIDSNLPIGSGFGSSAALAVGVAGAYLYLREGTFDHQRLLDVSLDVERRQHGTPSGIDNAAVLYGGLLWAERHGDRLQCAPLDFDPSLLRGLRVFHSGAPIESTGTVVSAIREERNRNSQPSTHCFEVIESCTRTLRSILEKNGSPTDLLALFRSCGQALESLGVVPEPVRRLIRRIERAGGAAKISGAGSLTGDGAGSILIYHPQPETIDRWDFLRPWKPLPVQFPAPGLKIEQPI